MPVDAFVNAGNNIVKVGVVLGEALMSNTRKAVGCRVFINRQPGMEVA